MATQTSSIPTDLTNAYKAGIFQILDATFNTIILNSLLHGIYTGITAVTLGNIFINRSQPIRQPMVIVIIILYIISTITFAFSWSEFNITFLDHGQNFWTNYIFYFSPNLQLTAVSSTGVICTLLADATMIWHCWVIWRQQWLIILLPVLLLVSAITFKIIATYEEHTDPYRDVNLYYVLYSSLVLASTVLCTLLIIYCIVTVAQGAAAGGGLRAYRHVIEVLVESSALYSIILILYVAFCGHNEDVVMYFDVLAATARGVAPTLLVGQVAAGHACPDDSWQGSVISGSLHFGVHSSSQSSQQDSMMSVGSEVQEERNDKDSHQTAMDSQEGIVDVGNNGSRQIGNSSMEHV